MRRLDSGLTFVEILMAVVVLSVLLVPLVTLMTTGFRDTQATIDEVQGANLAGELVEQLDALPFSALPPEGPASGVTLSTQSGSLADGVETVPGSGFRFHLSALPPTFSRELSVRRVGSTRREAVVTIRWTLNGFPRALTMKRVLVKDAILPTM